MTAFRQGIRTVPSVISRDRQITLDFPLYRNALVDALPALAAELVRVPVDVIVTVTTSATLAAFDATRTIPIVMGTTGGDPVALGWRRASPGRAAT